MMEAQCFLSTKHVHDGWVITKNSGSTNRKCVKQNKINIFFFKIFVNERWAGPLGYLLFIEFINSAFKLIQ